MSFFADLKREMRDAELTDGEWRGLREALKRGLFAQVPASARVEVPGVSKAGKAYLLVFETGPAGEIRRCQVDHDPDLSMPCFEAYVDKRVEWEREDAEKAPSGGGGDRG